MAAIEVVESVLAERRSTAAIEIAAFAALDPRDRALARRLVASVLRWLLRLDQVIERAASRPIARVDAALLSPLRLGVAQLLFLDRIPAHAAVSTSVDLAAPVSRRGAGFVNAVLRNVARAGGLEAFPVEIEDGLERLAVETSHPRFLVERWVSFFGEERARRALEAANRDRPASFLVLAGRRRRDAARRGLDELGLTAEISRLSPLGLLVESRGRRLPEPEASASPAALAGLYPQDEASQCAALVPPPEAGEKILDAAASPGGKSLTLLAWEPRARVVAADAGLARLARLAANARLADSPPGVVASDARRPGLGPAFDRVLADLPCSGSGTLRKHPELKWRIDLAEIERLATEAEPMLDGLAPLVRPGGLLVVSTCSLEPEENERQVERFLARHGDFAPLDLGDRLPEALASGVEAPGRWRLLPAAHHDGFTLHVLRRRAGGQRGGSAI